MKEDNEERHKERWREKSMVEYREVYEEENFKGSA